MKTGIQTELYYYYSVLWRQSSDLVAQELIQIAKFVAVSDLAVQGGVPLLLDSCGSTDFDGEVPSDATGLVGGLIGTRGVHRGSGCGIESRRRRGKYKCWEKE